MLKDDFLQQNGMSEYDRYCPFYKTSSMLRNFVAFHDAAIRAVSQGDVTFAKIRESTNDLMYKLSQMKFEVWLVLIVNHFMIVNPRCRVLRKAKSRLRKPSTTFTLRSKTDSDRLENRLLICFRSASTYNHC